MIKYVIKLKLGGFILASHSLKGPDSPTYANLFASF